MRSKWVTTSEVFRIASGTEKTLKCLLLLLKRQLIMAIRDAGLMFPELLNFQEKRGIWTKSWTFM